MNETLKTYGRPYRILGITGRKREGKDTVCELLTRHVDGAVARVALADPIKRFARDTWDLTKEQTDGESKEMLDERWGCSPRRIIQFVGTEVARGIHPDTWVRYLVREVERRAREMPRRPPTLYIVPDVRFKNEARVLREHGARVWRVDRGLPAEDQHASEMEIDEIEVDAALDNRRDIAHLKRQVHEAWAKTVYTEVPIP